MFLVQVKYCILLINDNLTDTCKSGIFRLSISDHYAIFCVNHNIRISDAKCTMIKREFTQRNISRFNKCVEKQSWISYCTTYSPIINHTHYNKREAQGALYR